MGGNKNFPFSGKEIYMWGAGAPEDTANVYTEFKKYVKILYFLLIKY